jgi:hypothetical protein
MEQNNINMYIGCLFRDAQSVREYISCIFVKAINRINDTNGISVRSFLDSVFRKADDNAKRSRNDIVHDFNYRRASLPLTQPDFKCYSNNHNGSAKEVHFASPVLQTVKSEDESGSFENDEDYNAYDKDDDVKEIALTKNLNYDKNKLKTPYEQSYVNADEAVHIPSSEEEEDEEEVNLGCDEEMPSPVKPTLENQNNIDFDEFEERDQDYIIFIDEQKERPQKDEKQNAINENFNCNKEKQEEINKKRPSLSLGQNNFTEKIIHTRNKSMLENTTNNNHIKIEINKKAENSSNYIENNNKHYRTNSKDVKYSYLKKFDTNKLKIPKNFKSRFSHTSEDFSGKNRTTYLDQNKISNNNSVKRLFQNYENNSKARLTSYHSHKNIQNTFTEKKIKPLNRSELRNFTATVRTTSTVMNVNAPEKVEPVKKNLVAL